MAATSSPSFRSEDTQVLCGNAFYTQRALTRATAAQPEPQPRGNTRGEENHLCRQPWVKPLPFPLHRILTLSFSPARSDLFFTAITNEPRAGPRGVPGRCAGRFRPQPAFRRLRGFGGASPQT